jgi:hypothetical protein
MAGERPPYDCFLIAIWEDPADEQRTSTLRYDLRLSRAARVLKHVAVHDLIFLP